MQVWLNKDRCEPLKVDRQPLPFFASLSLRQSVLWGYGLFLLCGSSLSAPLPCQRIGMYSVLPSLCSCPLPQNITLSLTTAYPGEFTEEEVERAIKRMKRHKAQGVDGITSDIIKLGGPMVLTYLTNIFNNILRTKQIPDSWHEGKIVILFKKGDPKDIKNYRPISLPVTQLQNIYKALAN